MQNYIETEAETVEEAIEIALTQLETTREDVNIIIINEPTKGILSFGAKPAKIRATLKEDISTAPETVLKEMLTRIGINGEVESNFIDGSLHLNMVTDSPALLIGKHGQTLDAIERLLNCIVNKNALAKKKVFVNTEGYRERREQTLVDLAHQVAAKVKRTRQDVVLAPMSAKDRRVIHLALQSDDNVSTFSQGEGDMRRIVITRQDNY
ncbi:MAG: Jag N-terminal domain-containing protein [Candidatus Poribacteria bacterium]|nr:Jag N-terminal domain-containing protein [Candidatus Poribacteria bacterium]